LFSQECDAASINAFDTFEFIGLDILFPRMSDRMFDPELGVGVG
jgi:hypothetical protein